MSLCYGVLTKDASTADDFRQLKQQKKPFRCCIEH